mgnify:CR=1 FL=1|tara:strand:+ start:702 stop:1952 length:1251 start_codon:yes stop_codon:yes gene_type:complete
MSVETRSTPSETAEAPERRCANCGIVLLGEHCYACGQPTKGLVRHFSSIIGDFMDSVFELDSRILRTLGPLLFKPGYLSLEYFEGRRVRYVSPVRLFVFLSLFAFFAAQLAFDISDDSGPKVAGTTEAAAGDANGTSGEQDAKGAEAIRAATTVAEVERVRDEILAELAKGRAGIEEGGEQLPGVAFGVGIGLDVAEQAVRNEADRRIGDIQRAEAAGEPVPVSEEAGEDLSINFGNGPWHPENNPVKVDWLGEAGNAKLNEWAGRMNDNAERVKGDPNLLKDAFLATVPTALFVLLPLFALMLKVMYVFKKRLYMEHLIVALHSHSFLCGSLLMVVILDALSTWTADWAWLSRPLGWLEIALVCWMPIYLLLMQKRVYRQGWIMTLFKYCVLGSCYLVLISFGASFALLASLVNM